MNESDIPIDIHYNKLLDWLLNRRHCQQQWQADAIEIRKKINTAIQDMPAVDEITKLLQGTYINYFHCQRIVELLKQTEDGSKNLFGRYSSQRMKDWIEIVSLYGNDGVYLAEAAQLLIRNVNYEIPALKRQIAKCGQSQNDCIRKEGEYASSSSELKEKYNASCRQLGIKGHKVKRELLELAKDLPSTYKQLEQQIKNIGPACSYYSEFVKFLLSSPQDCASLLTYIKVNGDTTTYEWKHGRAPAKVEAPASPEQGYRDNEADEAQTEEIVWGDLDDATNGIDFDISVEGSDDQQGTEDAINWSDDVAIEVVDDSTKGIVNTQDDGVARGSEALSLLDNTETRNMIINELFELQSFLTQRIQEMSGDSSVLTSGHTAPPSVQLDLSTVQEMLSNVNGIVDLMTSKKTQDLFLIRSSPRYVDRMADSLKKILQDSEKMMSLSRLMVTRQQEAMDEARDTQPKLDLICRRTKELQKQIEGEISLKYKKRRVNIMGEINTI